MTYTFGFRNAEYGIYDDLWNSAEVREAVLEECVKAVADMGSDAYEPQFPAFVNDVETWLGAMDDDVAMDEVQDAHQRGQELSAGREATRIMADFADVLGGRHNEADSKLPDGTAIYLSEQG